MSTLEGRHVQFIEADPIEKLERALEILEYSLSKQDIDPNYKEGLAGFQQEVVCSLLDAENDGDQYKKCISKLNGWLDENNESHKPIGLRKRTIGAFASYLVISTLLRNNVRIYEIPEEIDAIGKDELMDTTTGLPEGFDVNKFGLAFDYLIQLPGSDEWVPIDVKSIRLDTLKRKVRFNNQIIGKDAFSSDQDTAINDMRNSKFGVIPFSFEPVGITQRNLQHLAVIPSLIKVKNFEDCLDMDQCRPNEYYHENIATHIIGGLKKSHAQT